MMIHRTHKKEFFTKVRSRLSKLLIDEGGQGFLYRPEQTTCTNLEILPTSLLTFTVPTTHLPDWMEGITLNAPHNRLA